MNDWELLQEWSTRRSEDAFAQLVSRHLEFVYASARRQVIDLSLAEEVAQAVFLLLARKAGSLGREVILPSWLFRTTRFVASRALRSEQRRRRNELQSAVMNPESAPECSESVPEMWIEIAPHLDTAVASLSAADRDAILLRFFQRKSLRDVGGALGVSEEAAKKRVSRAIGKLRERLVARGTATSVPVLADLLNASPAEAIPGSLASTITAAAVVGSGSFPLAGALVDGADRDWTWVRWRNWTPWAAAALLMVSLSGLWLNRMSQATAPSGNAKEPPEPAMIVADISAEMASAAGTPAPTGERLLLLTVLAEEDSHPIADAQLQAVTRSLSQASGQNLSATPEHPGVFTLRVPTTDFHSLRVWISAPGRVPHVVTWRGYELTEPIRLHTSRLTRGLPFAGSIQDESGEPITDARLEFHALLTEAPQRENIGFNWKLTPVLSDAQGQFRTDQMPAHFGDHGIHVTIVHPDFAYGKLVLDSQTQLSSHPTIVLKRGVFLMGRVLADDGSPVPDIEVTADPMGVGSKPTTTTDVDGRFLLRHLLVGTASLRVDAPGYRELNRTVITDENAPEVVLNLKAIPRGTASQPGPKIRVTGVVVDHETEAPIPTFRVLSDLRHSGPSLLGEGFDGAFSWELESYDLQRDSTLIVEADGYSPQASEGSTTNLLSETQRFRLRRDTGLAGWVYQPDGRPAVGAEVSLAGDGFGLLLNQTANQSQKLVNAGNPVNRGVTDDRGRFSLPPQLGVRRVAIIHPSGCLILPSEAATNGAVRLEAWGEIAGTAMANAHALPGTRINVGFASPSYGPDDLRIRFDFSTITDAQGRFHFTNVPPGHHYVQRVTAPREGKSGPIGFSHGESLTVSSGEIARVTLGGRGRSIVGHLVSSRPVPDYNWNWDMPTLVLERPDLKQPRFGGDPSTKDLRTERLESFASSAYDLACKKYYLIVQPDGAFRADDVLPGDYALKVVVKAPPTDPLAEEWEWNRAQLGKLTQRVVVSEIDGETSADPIDIGIVTVPLKSP